MKFFKQLAKGVAGVASVAGSVVLATVEPTALINNAGAAVLKRIPFVDRQSIPGINAAVTVGSLYVKQGMATGQWGLEGLVPAAVMGVKMAAISTGIHQGVKVPLKKATGRSI